MSSLALTTHSSPPRLRSFIFGTQQELLRFRQLVVNIVLATDIFNKSLGDARKQRWNKAFAAENSVRNSTRSSLSNSSAPSEETALRATIVIEHVIQASDVSHTMQHW